MSTPGRVMEAMREVEKMTPEIVAAYEADLRLSLATIEAEKGDPAWARAWRPGWMYLLGFLWLWNLVGLHMANAFWKIALPPLTGFAKPLASSKTNTPVFTLGGASLVMREFTLDLGNQIETRFLINSESVMLVDRAEKVSVTVEAEAMTLINPYALAAAQTTQAIVLQQGVAAGARATINVPMAQLQRPSGLEQSQNIVEWPLSLIPLPNTGNDQWTLVLT